MSKYQTARMFGLRRATIGDVVILACARHDNKPGICLRDGVVSAISSTSDMPYIRVGGDTVVGVGALAVWDFMRTCNVNDIESMPIGCWTWPLPPIGWRDVGSDRAREPADHECG